MLSMIQKNRKTLKALVDEYHPSKRYVRDGEIAGAQFACDMAMQSMRDPVDFDKALEKEDMPELYKILNETWFGIPEKRPVPDGFDVLCSILEGFND